MDKNGEIIDQMDHIGFGFIEIGTVTPKAQYGNPKPRLKRLVKEESLINSLGFNNKGAPLLLNPKLFIKDSSLTNLLSLGLGFPYCAFGVTVPISMKPNPM